MIHGVLNVYKEKGYTSHDVVAKLRGIMGQKKIGHTGTLDPGAVGVLPVCLGKGTKLVELLTDENKTYETVLLLGKTTDTQDIFGEILSEKSTEDLTEELVREAVLSFMGEYAQIPPMYSALKVNGKKLYELARSGQVVERKARPVKILEIRVLDISLPRVRMSVTCSKGTYIRTLCHDIGKKLGCGGCMEELSRTRVGRFAIDESRTLEEIRTIFSEGRINEYVVPVDEMFRGALAVTVKAEWEKAARNGNALPEEAVEKAESLPGEAAEKADVPSEEAAEKADTLPEESAENRNMLSEGAAKGQANALGRERVRLYDSGGRFIGLYIWKKEIGEYHLEKMFFPER